MMHTACYSFGIGAFDALFIGFIGLSGFIMGAAACRDMEIVIEARKEDQR